MPGIRQVIAVSGHMIDKPDRTAPRFPPEAERRVASEIGAVFDDWGVGPDTVVLSQGARGTDILAAEAALERGADVRLMLALPVDEYEAESVTLPRSRWGERYRALLATRPVSVQTEVLGPLPPGENPFDRNNHWVLAEAGRLAEAESARIRALAVWDRSEEDGKGGTADFARAVQERGGHVHVIRPREAWRTPNVPYWERQPADGPKRLLALDGGGIRGVITLEILARMEEVLGGADPSFALSDYFDYIAGTSTGAIIASALSLGRRVGDVTRLYRELGPAIFKKRFLPARLRSLYKDRGLTTQLKDFLGADTTLGADELRALLLVVMHRIDTDSIWPLSNNTHARYNDRSRPDCNLNFPIWQVVRGSTAAPIFFRPEEIPVGTRSAHFEDGGVTPFNNPALLLFEMATSPRYHLGWSVGPSNLLVVSVGTGFSAAAHPNLKGRRINLIFQAQNLVKVIMNGSSVENDRLCRVLGQCRWGENIDGEFNASDVAETPVVAPLVITVT